MQRFHIDGRFSFGFWPIAKYPGRTFEQLVTPLLDLVGVNIKVLRQFDQGLFTFDRGNSHFRLECRAVVPARSSRHGHLLARSIMLLLRGKSTYPTCSVFPNHLLVRTDRKLIR